MLKVARVVDESTISTDAVAIGTHVKLLDVEFEDEEEYFIVGSSEADPSQNRLSYESPVGKALLGHTKGETVSCETPACTIDFVIKNIYKYEK